MSDTRRPRHQTEEHRANLRQLAAHLRTRPSEAFNMRRFARAPGFVGDVMPAGAAACGTVCCALGSGPAAGLPALCSEGWGSYGRRVFGFDSLDPETHEVRIWEWMFASSWIHTDNTPAGAAARIEWWLDRGLPPDSVGQCLGVAPLCYCALEEEIRP